MMQHYLNIIDEFLPGEEWKDIPGTRNAVSSYGRVKSYIRRGRILRQNITKWGYLQVQIESKKLRVHRLVAEAFILNSENKKCINHIDGNKKNNYYTNLEWSTHSENQLHAYRVLDRKRSALGVFGKDNPLSKPILQLSITGEFVREWDCAKDVQRVMGLRPTDISEVLHGKQKTAFGFKWTFKQTERRLQSKI